MILEKFICSLFSIGLIFNSLVSNAAYNTSFDTKELNWYYVSRNNSRPTAPPESNSFLDKYDSYFIGNESEKVLYLTFDEGYENGNTSSILDTLKKHEVPAAFFVVKPYIEKNKDLIKRMADEGHLVCNHSNTHPSMAKILEKEKFEKEFTSVEESFKEITGKDLPKFFRPPMGKYSELSLKQTKDLGYKTIFWSFAYRDWLVDSQPSHDVAKNKILSNIHNGSIILLHAVSNTNKDILDNILTELKNKGYVFKSLYDI